MNPHEGRREYAETTIATLATLARRAQFASKHGRPVVVMPNEVRALAMSAPVTAPASVPARPWTREEATEDMLRRIEDGTARLFGQRVILGPLRRGSDPVTEG